MKHQKERAIITPKRSNKPVMHFGEGKEEIQAG